jgi:S-adenosylmethionine:tRNA-ribosyltransferase-isomerase (queuine synthetase)
MNHIYKTAVDKKYRFLSYGDAMLLSRKWNLL